MARAFRYKRGRFVAELDPEERALLVGLFGQTRLVLAPRTELTGDPFADLVASLSPDGASDAGAGVGEDERDAALERLLPRGHRSDDEAAQEFRRLTEESLRQRKVGNIDAAVAALEAVGEDGSDRLTLEPAQAVAMVTALTDLRLLIAERMGMRTDADADALLAQLATDEAHPLAYAHAVYDFLTWLQEGLSVALMKATPRR